MRSILNSAFLTVYSVLFFSAFASPVHADGQDDNKHNKQNNNWEILVNQADPIAFYGFIAGSSGPEVGIAISPLLMADTLPGSTVWVKGNVYPAGTVNQITLDEPSPDKKIGEWYCTGTRTQNPFAAEPGSLYEITDFTYAFNDGTVIHTKQINYSGQPARQHVFYSEVKGIKAGDTLINDNSFFVASPTFRILVTDIKKIKK